MKRLKDRINVLFAKNFAYFQYEFGLETGISDKIEIITPASFNNTLHIAMEMIEKIKIKQE